MTPELIPTQPIYPTEGPKSKVCVTTLLMYFKATLVVTFHFIRTDASFLKEFTILKTNHVGHLGYTDTLISRDFVRSISRFLLG